MILRILLCLSETNPPFLHDIACERLNLFAQAQTEGILGSSQLTAPYLRVHLIRTSVDPLNPRIKLKTHLIHTSVGFVGTRTKPALEVERFVGFGGMPSICLILSLFFPLIQLDFNYCPNTKYVDINRRI